MAKQEGVENLIWVPRQGWRQSQICRSAGLLIRKCNQDHQGVGSALRAKPAPGADTSKPPYVVVLTITP